VLVSLSTKARKRVAFIGAITLAAGLVVVAIPALAADDTGQTVVAQVGADGSVTTVEALGGATKPSSNALPITMKVSASQNGNTLAADKVAGAGGTIGLRYVVTNTTSKQQDINYNDPKGQAQTLKVELQVPYVAQLDVILPQGWTGVHASGASISSMPDGSLDVRWSMVLFSPLGSPTQSVALTATGSGKKAPVATLSARVVNPTADSTLSTTGVDANSTIAQNGLLGSYADGAKSGLDQLADGAGQLLIGLQQLADGAQQLHAGLVEGQNGTNQLVEGMHSSKGKDDLVGGSKALAAGVQSISAGLGQLANTTTGLPAAFNGVLLLQSGVGDLVDALGDAATAHTIRNGIALAQGGVAQLLAGVTALSDGAKQERDGILSLQPGIHCAAHVVRNVADGVAAAASDPCYFDPDINPTSARPALPPSVGLTKILLDKVADGLEQADVGIGDKNQPADHTLIAGILQIAGGLSNPTCNPQCGVLEGLGALAKGLSSPTCDINHPEGIPNANPPKPPCGLKEGLDAVAAGLSSPKCDPLHPLGNPGPPATPPCGVTQGLAALNVGLGKAVEGANLLSDGSVDAAKGAGNLAAGVGLESNGLDQLAEGLPAATDGSKQIADGLNQTVTGAQQIANGQTQVRDAAVVPIAQALAQGGGNAAGTLAVLAALSTSASKPPLGTGTTLILTQSDINPGSTWPLWLAIVVAAAAVIVGLVVGLLIGPRRRRHGV
jgi:putative membrane protein